MLIYGADPLGHIRALQNLIERAVILSSGERLDVTVSEMDEGIGSSKAHVMHCTLEDVDVRRRFCE